ncbi:MAG TPA: hypothetical protein VJ437_13595 [Acidiferrobacterales bacterium]|nr:hypothetical protein [Acidiferrobacterales bacterium]
MADMKVGAYICKGCGIGERLNTAQLATIAQKEGKAQVVREHEFLCNSQGVEMIRNDIANEGVNRAVQGGTAASLRAIQVINRVSRAEA